MYINRQKIAELMDSDTIEPLESELEIEDLIVTIDSLNRKVDFLSRLKKNRVSTIDEEIDKNKVRKQKLQEVIVATLESVGEKSLSFPGVGKVVTKQPKGKWNISDEDALVEHLKKTLTADDFDAVVPTKPSIAKKELNKILDGWEKSGEVPKSVEREETRTSLSVTIDKNLGRRIDVDDDDGEDLSEKSVTEKGYDSIEF